MVCNKLLYFPTIFNQYSSVTEVTNSLNPTTYLLNLHSAKHNKKKLIVSCRVNILLLLSIIIRKSNNLLSLMLYYYIMRHKEDIEIHADSYTIYLGLVYTIEAYYTIF